MLALTLLTLVGAAAAPPADPVVTTGANGAYAAAVPAFAGRPVIAGDSVVFAVEDSKRDRLFSIGAASATGARELYAAPRKRPGSATALVASKNRVVALRMANRTISCFMPGECTAVPGTMLAGPADGRLQRVVRTPERMPATASCRRRIAQLDDFDVSVSGARVAYVRRVRCLTRHRRGRSQVVVRDLRTGAVRVVYRGRARDVQLAGRYLAFDPDGGGSRAVVLDLKTRRVVYRARAVWYSLGRDGTLATVTTFPGLSLRGRLAWYSPKSPHRHRLPNRVHAFNAAPLAYADGRIAYIRRYDDNSAELAVTDLDGNEQLNASFAAPELLEAFAFDGTRLAFAHTRYRPDQGAADDGLPAICVGDTLLVPASATVVEVHAVTDPTRMPAAQLPSAPAYRSPAAERPECPERD